jgi:hypothetical protein
MRTLTAIMAIRSMSSMSITNFESIIMASLNIMVKDLNAMVAEDLSTMLEDSAMANIQSTVAGMYEVIAVNTQKPAIVSSQQS